MHHRVYLCLTYRKLGPFTPEGLKFEKVVAASVLWAVAISVTLSQYGHVTSFSPFPDTFKMDTCTVLPFLSHPSAAISLLAGKGREGKGE